MKRIITIFAIFLFAATSYAENDGRINTYTLNASSQSGDWREGIWHRRVKENFIFLDLEGTMNVVDKLKETNPFGAGFRVGFEHKTRPSTISSRYSIGFGLQMGVSRYFSSDIKVDALGSHDAVKRDSYKAYTEIPVLLNFNWYYNFERSAISLGLSAGVNLMLGQRDVSLDYVIVDEFFGMSVHNIEFEDYVASKQQDANNVSLSHVRPTGRVVLGYMRELSQDWRLRIQAGVEYQMQYEDKYSGYFIDKGYIELYHEGTSAANINPFLSVGLGYSL
ncbi:MAG: hypothetical protein IJ748_06470 [Bacteroidales bacterium]|nr:hypothetical protein [Bacteroidales bacterium]